MRQLIKNDIDLLEIMLEDQEKQNETYRPGPYWKNYQIRYTKAIRKHGIDSFRSHPQICKAFAMSGIYWPEYTYTSDHRFIPNIKGRIKKVLMHLPLARSIIEDHKNVAKTHFNRQQTYLASYMLKAIKNINFPENTKNAGAANILKISKKKECATDYLYNLLRIQNFSQHVDFSSLKSVIEIGGGIGVFPHLLHHLYPNIKKFLYLDIPPMIYLATQYLKQFFNVRDYRETRHEKEITFSNNNVPEVICLCPWQIEKIKPSIDLLWNAASFSEMTEKIVKNYAGHLNKLQLKAICLILNKDGKGKTCPRSDILNAFDGGFTEITQLDELLNAPPYFVKCINSG